MASRHVDVNERRLRPVYDALDSMNNKQAIQLADKILKKQKDLHCAKALKALALLRSGKSSESEALMEEIMDVRPADDSTLQAMTICFREMQKPEVIPQMYEMALKQNPQNEELNTHLFMAYVRIEDYKKQKQAAMNLYKLYSKNPYYFWAVMSVVMQAMEANDEKLSKSMLFPLAEKMVAKFVDEGKIDAEAEVHLYIFILEKLELYEKSLEVLRGKLGDKLVSYLDKREEKEAGFLMKLCRWHEANVAYKKLLWRRPDQWSFYQAYFSSAFALMKEAWSPEDGWLGELPDHSVEMIDTFLASIVESEKSKEKRACRGPFIAQLELHKLLIELEEACICSTTQQCSNSVSVLDLEVDYFKRFGDKPTCFWDLCPYLHLFFHEKEDKQKFIENLKMTLPSLSEKEPESSHIKVMLRKLTIEQISRHLGFHCSLSGEEKISLSKELMKQHRDGLVYGQHLLHTELQFSDGFAQLAAHILLEVNDDRGTREMNWHILMMLESALKASPSNHHLKILVMRVYCSMGAFGPCFTLFESLEVKHIEQDILGYIVTRYAEALGHFEAASSVYSTAQKFFVGNQKNTPEYIISAYKYGSFEKIPEFASLKKRLNLSLHFPSVTYESMLLDVYLKTNSLSDAQNHFTENSLLEKCPASKEWMKDLKDNRDLRIMQMWDPPDRQLTKDQERHCREQEVLWLRLRCLVLRALVLAVSLVPKPLDNVQAMNNGEADPLFPLEGLISELEEVLQEVDKHPGTRAKLPFVGPPCSRLSGFLDGHHGTMLLTMLKVCNQSQQLHYAAKEAASQHLWSNVKGNVEEVSRILKDSTLECTSRLTTSNEDRTMFNGYVVEPLVLLVETYYSIILLAAVCCTFLHKLKGGKKAKKKKPSTAAVCCTVLHKLKGGKKAKKKKPSTGATNEEVGPFKDFLSTLKSCVSELHSALVEVNIAQLSEDILKLNLVELDNETKSSIVPEIWEKIQTSYKQSVKEISELLRLKVTFAKSLHL